jgi:adenylate cyclase
LGSLSKINSAIQALRKRAQFVRLRVGFQPSVSILFIAVVLGVGLSVIALSFRQARTITRTAASAYLDKVAQHSADRVSSQFQAIADALRVLRQLPAVESGTIEDNPNLYRLLAAFLRGRSHIYNFYVGYDDGAFLELDASEHVEADIRARLEAPAGARFRLVCISPAHTNPPVRHTIFLDEDLRPVEETRVPSEYDPRARP